MAQSAREIAYNILLEWQKCDSYSNLLLNKHLKKSELDDRDKRLVTELVYGCIQRLNTLDWIIDDLVKKGISSLADITLQILRIGIYQLYFLDKIPERAAVHEMVEIAKRHTNKGAVALINGVLRSFLRNKPKFRLPHPVTLVEKSLIYSTPAWIIERLQSSLGIDNVSLILQEQFTPPKTSLRINNCKQNRDDWLEKCALSGGKAYPSVVSPFGVVIEGGGNIAFSEPYKAGTCTIQDESSMLVAPILGPKPGMNILDACAAPGGKTTHLAELMDNKGSLVACDLHPHKAALIKGNVKRLNLFNIETITIDARLLVNKFAPQTFDAILLDAPCSGFGVIKRKPDIKWRRQEEDIAFLVKLQRELLQSLAPLVKPGGVLVYSTCTWEQNENQVQIEWFLNQHNNWKVESCKPYVNDLVWKKASLSDGCLQVLPYHFNSDGFFMARLVKN